MGRNTASEFVHQRHSEPPAARSRRPRLLLFATPVTERNRPTGGPAASDTPPHHDQIRPTPTIFIALSHIARRLVATRAGTTTFGDERVEMR